MRQHACKYWTDTDAKGKHSEHTAGAVGTTGAGVPVAGVGAEGHRTAATGATGATGTGATTAEKAKGMFDYGLGTMKVGLRSLDYGLVFLA